MKSTFFEFIKQSMQRQNILLKELNVISKASNKFGFEAILVT